MIVGAKPTATPLAGGAGGAATGAAIIAGALAAFASLLLFPEHPPSNPHSATKAASRWPQLTLSLQTQFIFWEILSLWNLAGRPYLSIFSALALRCFGCTIQAMPMLNT